MSEKIDGKKIIIALNVIKKVCIDNIDNPNGECTFCPFGIDGKCGITDLKIQPNNWKIAKYEKFQALSQPKGVED